MPQGLTDDSAVRNAYHELYELGQAFQTMYQAGALGASPEEFLDNFQMYESTLQSLGDFEQLKTAVAADVVGPYAGDHLEFVSQVMPLIPDQDGYAYDVKQRWYKDGEVVTERSDPAGFDDLAPSVPGRMLDEEKGLYYDETNWYDGNGTLLEWDATRNLYAAGNQWYDQNFVPLTWSDEKNLYYDSNNTWIDTNGFPLSWAEEGFYLSSGGARYDQYANPLPDTPVTEPAAADETDVADGTDETDVADETAPAVSADVQAAVDDVIAAILEEAGTEELTSEEISELIADVLKDLQAA